MEYLCIAIYVYFLSILTLAKEYKKYVPYHSIFNPVEEKDREQMRDERFNM